MTPAGQDLDAELAALISQSEQERTVEQVAAGLQARLASLIRVEIGRAGEELAAAGIILDDPIGVGVRVLREVADSLEQDQDEAR